MQKEQSQFILEELEKHGYEAYFVGGCVRDWLLGRVVHDIDICTNAHPGDIMRIFPNHVPTGLKHGTVSVKHGTCLFEVTTYRTEGEYKDYRRPEEVTFVSSLEEDLARRDFTVNAMAMDRHGTLVDPFGGQQDLRDRKIRAVGEAAVRFQEDALRLLRAVRFASQLGFQIEQKTYRAMQEKASLLIHIAIERIREELHKLLDSVSPQKGVGVIADTRLLRSLPSLQNLFQTTVEEAWRLVRLRSLPQKWAFLLYVGGVLEEEAECLTKELRMSKKETESISRLVRILLHLGPVQNQSVHVDWPPLLIRYGLAVCMDVHHLLYAFAANGEENHSSQALADIYLRLPVKHSGELAVNGLELQQAISKKPGEWIASTLVFLLEQTALHGLPNTKEALLAAARKEVEKDEY